MVAQWFYQTAERQQSGPIDSKELRRLAEAGIVRPDTLIRQSESANWVRAERVRGLFQQTTPPLSSSSLVKATLVHPPAPPPLPSALRESVASRSVGGESPVRHGRGPAAVNEASEKPYRIHPSTWAAIITGTGFVLLLLWTIAFWGGGALQQAEKDQPPRQAAKQPIELPAAQTPQQESNRPVSEPPAAPPAVESKSNAATGNVKYLELADLAELVGPSVVQVDVTGPDAAGTGSGFVLDKQGTIVTNFHVIDDATTGRIVFSDRTSAPITGYLGVWPEKDIALVQVQCPSEKLHPLGLATSMPRQGERVAAFGSPLGLQQSVSEGIVSAVRKSEELQSFGPIGVNAHLIQTTTPISHGNSGGPLVDMEGRVVGVNTLTFRVLGGENVNFAVSVIELPPLLLAKNETPSPLPGNNPADKVRRILSRAKDRYDAGDYPHAIADYTEAIRFDPTNPFSFSSRGNAYLKGFDYDNAIADYTDAIRLDPKDPLNYSARGRVYILKQDNDSALADFTEAIRLDPKNADWHYWRGFAYMVKGDNDLAIADYNEAIFLKPLHPSAIVARGTAYRQKGDYDSAIADYTEDIRLDPKRASTFRARGDAYREKGDYDRAIADYDEAIRLDPTRLLPDYYFIFYGRGECYRKKMDYDLAIDDYTEAIRLWPGYTSAFTSRGNAYREKRDYDRAIADYTEAIRIDPQKAEAYWERGKAYELKGNKAIAKRDLEQATKLGYKPPDSRSRKRNPAGNESKVAETEVFPESGKVRDQWRKLVIGMPYPQVEKLLGRPNEVTQSGSGLANWTYRFDWTPYGGAVMFNNGRVMGWSEPLDWKLDK